MEAHLSIVLDYESARNRQDLKTFSSLEKLDQYMIKFNNPSEIRQLYQNDIQEFLLDNRDIIMKSKRNLLGRICIVVQDNRGVHYVPIIYKPSKHLLLINVSRNRIIESLNDDKVLKEILNRKRNILSQYEIDCLSKYFYRRYDYFKKCFIEFFVSKLRHSDNRYYFIRTLMHICNLFDEELKLDRGTIKYVNSEKIKESNGNITKTLGVHIKDENLLYLYEKGDYDTILNYYGQEIVDELKKMSHDE